MTPSDNNVEGVTDGIVSTLILVLTMLQKKFGEQIVHHRLWHSRIAEMFCMQPQILKRLRLQQDGTNRFVGGIKVW